MCSIKYLLLVNFVLLSVQEGTALRHAVLTCTDSKAMFNHWKISILKKRIINIFVNLSQCICKLDRFFFWYLIFTSTDTKHTLLKSTIFNSLCKNIHINIYLNHFHSVGHCTLMCNHICIHLAKIHICCTYGKADWNIDLPGSHLGIIYK